MLGMNSQALKDKMNQLEVIKVNLESEIVVASSENKQEAVTKITEEQVKEMVADMKKYVMERDLPQCKQLIKDFVEEVVVYRDHIEVKFNMVFFSVHYMRYYSLLMTSTRKNIN